MYADHEDGAVVHALDRLPQPEIQHRQSDEYVAGATGGGHVTHLPLSTLVYPWCPQIMWRRSCTPSD